MEIWVRPKFFGSWGMLGAGTSSRVLRARAATMVEKQPKNWRTMSAGVWVNMIIPRFRLVQHISILVSGCQKRKTSEVTREKKGNLKVWDLDDSIHQVCVRILNIIRNMPLVLRLPRNMHLCRSSSNVPRLSSFLEMPQNPHVVLTCDKVHNLLRLPRETTSEHPKVVWTCSAFNTLTSKCASRILATTS